MRGGRKEMKQGEWYWRAGENAKVKDEARKVERGKGREGKRLGKKRSEKESNGEDERRKES
jgi:hypothetical protein